MKFAAFDVELADSIPDGLQVWNASVPPGISCAAIAVAGAGVELFSGVPQMSTGEARALVERLTALEQAGYRIITWNGCAFDFAVLARQSGMLRECARLAACHTDLMLLVTFTKGYFLSLDKALQGALLKGKVKEVALQSGAVVTGMTGALAPKLWQQGEYAAVTEYLTADVEQLLLLAAEIESSGRIFWFSNTNKPQFVKVPSFLTVKECQQIPLPDTSWMQNPPLREQFTAWMGEYASEFLT